MEMQTRLVVALTSYQLSTGQEPWRLVIDEAGAIAPHGQKTYFTPEAAAAKVGMRIRTRRDFAGAPRGTTGRVAEYSESTGGFTVWVAWDGGGNGRSEQGEWFARDAYEPFLEERSAL